MATFETLKQRLSELDRVDGISPVEILDLPEGLHVAVRKMLKHPMSLGELANELSLSPEQTLQIGDILVDKGFLRLEPPDEVGTMLYRVRFARMRGHHVPLDL